MGRTDSGIQRGEVTNDPEKSVLQNLIGGAEQEWEVKLCEDHSFKRLCCEWEPDLRNVWGGV